MIPLYRLNMETLAEVYCYEFYKVHKQYPKPELLNRKVLLAKCEQLQKMSARSQ
jgi:hypothetical protein